MMRWSVAICLLTLGASVSADELSAWHRAAENFSVGRERRRAGQPARDHFRRAADDFLEIARRNPRHAEAYLNLGRSCFLAGQYPEAIAAFNAGLAVDPFDSRLHDGLAIARREVSLPAGSRLIGDTVTGPRVLFSRWLDGVFGFAAIVACLTLPAGIRGRRRRWLVVGVSALAIAAFAGVALGERAKRFDDLALRPAVLLREDTPFRVGNSEGFEMHPEAPLLPRGYEVQRIGERGGWLHVACPGGQIGWVPAASVVSWR